MPGRGMGEVCQARKYISLNSLGYCPQRLVIDPNSNNILFFGARSGHGLWKSTNYGSSWTQVTSLPSTGMSPRTSVAYPDHSRARNRHIYS